jgi:Myb-like DNA-binding domain.
MKNRASHIFGEEENPLSSSLLSSQEVTQTKPGLISEVDFSQFIARLESDIQENINGTSWFPDSNNEKTRSVSSSDKADWFPWLDLSDKPLISCESPVSTSNTESILELSLSSPPSPKVRNSSKDSGAQKVIIYDAETFWNEENIKKLFYLSHQLKQDWKKVAKKFQVKYLSPTIVRNKYRQIKYNDIPLREKFTHEEDLLIAKYYNIYGLQWKKIAEHLKARTHIMVKNRFYSHIKRNNLLESLLQEINQAQIERDGSTPQDF